MKPCRLDHGALVWKIVHAGPIRPGETLTCGFLGGLPALPVVPCWQLPDRAHRRHVRLSVTSSASRRPLGTGAVVGTRAALKALMTMPDTSLNLATEDSEQIRCDRKTSSAMVLP